MKRSTITSIALLAALVGSSAASAASYDYTPTMATSASPRFPTLGSTPSFRPPRLAIPSFCEIKESNGVRKLSEKNRILFLRSPR
jgi:hypothetical protein